MHHDGLHPEAKGVCALGNSRIVEAASGSTGVLDEVEGSDKPARR